MAFYQRAYELSQQSGALSNLSIIAQEMQSLYKETGPSDSTLKYLSLYNEYTEKLKEEEARFALNHQELLTNFRAREQKSLFRQRMIFLGYLFLALILLFVATWLFIKTRRNLRQSNLAKMNLELARQRLELENGSLKSEVEQKNKELAANTMYSLQKNELIGSVVEKLLDQFKSKTPISPDALRPVIRELEQSKDDKIWEEFEVNFSKVHADFYKNLNQINPDLTPNERRLCAFLKLNMSTKDISAITGQTPHSIKIARARLRKKFNLTNSDTSLLAFLAET
jgi:DNA-binding CsgD family transcriptional regulator